MISMMELCDVVETAEEEVPEFIPDSKTNVAAGGMNLNLVSFWMRSDYDKPEKGTARYVLLTPDGKRFRQPPREIDLATSPTARFILIVDKLIFRGFGLYYFLTEQRAKSQSKWSRVAKVPLLVRPMCKAQQTEEVVRTTKKKAKKKTKKKQKKST
jgi:hypothetical protein